MNVGNVTLFEDEGVFLATNDGKGGARGEEEEEEEKDGVEKEGDGGQEEGSESMDVVDDTKTSSTPAASETHVDYKLYKVRNLHTFWYHFPSACSLIWLIAIMYIPWLLRALAGILGNPRLFVVGPENDGDKEQMAWIDEGEFLPRS